MAAGEAVPAAVESIAAGAAASDDAAGRFAFVHFVAAAAVVVGAAAVAVAGPSVVGSQEPSYV